MNETQKELSTVANGPDREKPPSIFSLHGVRYQVTDVARAAFYTDHPGFTLHHQQLPAFASVSLGDLRLLLSFGRRRSSRSPVRHRRAVWRPRLMWRRWWAHLVGALRVHPHIALGKAWKRRS